MSTNGAAGAGAAAAAAAAAAAIANATKASGVIVRIGPGDFSGIVNRSKNPLVVHAEGGFFSTNHQYLTSYRGLAFFTKSGTPIDLPADTERVQAEKIWIPG